MPGRWQPLPFDAWADTRDTVHLWTQVVGKVKLTLTPFLNEWWNVGLTLTARGLTTGPMPCGAVDLQCDFDFVGDELVLATSDGRRGSVALAPRTVADFYAATIRALAELGVDCPISPLPSEVADPVPFDQDIRHASYDPDAVRRWWRAMLDVSGVIDVFRSPFGGKSSPTLFYWGGCDLNSSRFSGRPAPARSDGGEVMALGEDQENFAFGFWPGSSASPMAVLYAYFSPAPAGVEALAVEPETAAWVPPLGEFVLPWDALIASPDPAATAHRFFSSVYDAGARLAGWDLEALAVTRLPRSR